MILCSLVDPHRHHKLKVCKRYYVILDSVHFGGCRKVTDTAFRHQNKFKRAQNYNRLYFVKLACWNFFENNKLLKEFPLIMFIAKLNGILCEKITFEFLNLGFASAELYIHILIRLIPN
jgi:hypothetical protein